MSGVSSYQASAPLGAYTLPLGAIAYNKPDEEITEAEKFADNGEFFMRMNRWIVLNFFNPFNTKFYHAEAATTRSCDDMVENFAYYFGRQRNKTFSYTETINENDTIQAVYVPDQKIRALIDPMIGQAVKLIQPIKDSISAKVLSKDYIKGKEELRRKLEIKKHLAELLSQAQGVSFAPNGVDDMEDESVDDIVDQFKHEQEAELIKCTQGIYYKNDLSQKFEQSAFHEFINNISTFYVDDTDDTEVTFIPCYNSIIDTRATDDFLSDALLSGFVQFLSPAEIFQKWGNDLTDDEKKHINSMSQKQYSNWLECYNYYNTGCDNITWWCRQTGKVSCVTTFWIGKKDLRYKKTSTRYGGMKVVQLQDNEEYTVWDEKGRPMMENGKPVRKKGSEIKGDASNWFVHTDTIIGNYCHVGFGYTKTQVRPYGQKQKPLLPTVQFVHRMVMGFSRSIASRLRHYSDEKGRLKLKIQELTGRDIGRVYALFADKLALSEQESQEVFKDFKTMGFSIFNKTGEASGEDGKLTADVLDFSLSPSITAYIELCREADAAMMEISSTNQYSLGSQQAVVGRSVQETSIQQAALGQISLFDGLMEHWRRVLSLATNVEKKKMAGKEYLSQTSLDSAALVRLNKDMAWQDIGLYIMPTDELEADERKLMMDGIFSYNQNGGQPQAAEALLNSLHLINFNSISEGIDHLEDFVAKQKREVSIQNQQTQAAQAQQGQAEITLTKLFDMKMQESKDENANFRAELTATLVALSKMHSDIEKSSMQLLTALSSQQPVTPIAQDIAASSQQQSSQQAQ